MRSCAYYRQPFNECPVSSTMAHHLLCLPIVGIALRAEENNTVQQSDNRSPIADNFVSNAAPGETSVHEHDTDHEMIGFDRLALGSERLGGMVVRSAQVRKVLKTISLLSPYKATVLISGESGTGKELVARALHTLGPV